VQGVAGQGERLAWADLAKGATILLVVLWHVHLKHYMDLGWVTELPVRRAWIEFHIIMIPVRMPLFFAISGMFAAAALRRPWRQVALRRIASPYYLYVLWVLISAAVYTALRSEIDYLMLTSAWQLPAKLVVPTGTLWYVYALATYFLLAKLLRKVPVWVVLPGAALLSAASIAGWLPSVAMVGSITRNFVFFLTGVCLPGLIKHVAARAGRRQLILTGLGYGCVVAVYLLGLRHPLGDVVAAFVSIWFGVVAVSHLARWRALARVGTYIGRNTLPIFVLHVPLIAGIRWLAEGPAAPLWGRVLHNDLVAGLYPLVLALVIVAISLLVHRVLLTAGAWWLFGLTNPQTQPLLAKASITPVLEPQPPNPPPTPHPPRVNGTRHPTATQTFTSPSARDRQDASAAGAAGLSQGNRVLTD
jgi:uncharacterized membrane protein YcfT